MYEWKELGAKWPSEQAYQVLELLKQNHIRCRMPADDMFFTSPFFLPHPDRRWAIQVRRRDAKRAMALLVREGLARDVEAPVAAATQATRSPDPLEAARRVFRRPVSTAPAAQLDPASTLQ